MKKVVVDTFSMELFAQPAQRKNGLFPAVSEWAGYFGFPSLEGIRVQRQKPVDFPPFFYNLTGFSNPFYLRCHLGTGIPPASHCYRQKIRWTAGAHD